MTGHNELGIHLSNRYRIYTSDILRVATLPASENTQISFHGLYKLVQAPKVSKVTSRQARSIFYQVDEILY